jgi:DNA-binding response OmpR family regulator
MARAVAQVLKKNNYSVDLAHNGEDGLDLAASGVYDVVILDIMLPKLDGISILREMRNRNVTTPVILLTAKGETEDKIAGLDSGADDYLAKPFQTVFMLLQPCRHFFRVVHAQVVKYEEYLAIRILHEPPHEVDQDVHVHGLFRDREA